MKLKTLSSYLALTMNSLGCTLIHQEYKGQHKQLLQFTSRVSLPKSRQTLDLLWEVTIHTSLLKITVKINAGEACSGPNLCSFFKEKRVEVC